MAAYASLISLLNFIERIQRQTRFPMVLDQKQMESLHEKVCFFSNFLESDSHGNGQEAKHLESQIKKLACEAEDIIERHVVHTITATSQANQITIRSFAERTEGLMEVIDSLMTKTRFFRGTVDSIAPKSSSYIPTGTSSTMVGLDEELIQIMEWLTGHQSGRQIIPISGMGGIGKTTLAQNVYVSPVIVQHFHIRAWISISQEYISRHILLLLLSQVKDVKEREFSTFMNEMSQMSEEVLGERLYKSLCGMRYLVVLDDVWSIEAWETIKLYFPDNKNGSRIIVTTRLSGVASHFGSCGLRMNFLDEDRSWNLLCERVFAKEGCPLELVGGGQQIARNCKGLPLSIVVIGGLLAKSGRTTEYWEHVARNTHSLINLEADEHCVKILSLSYDNLPVHLKPCFLYMGVFPEDKEIRVSWLINLWVAEGF